jgi:hypothetical protein
MRRQFPIADLLWLIATFAVILAVRRWVGSDGVILARPFGGVIVGRLSTRAISESARLRRLSGTLTASGLAIAAWLADPRPQVTTAAELAFGIPLCVLYGFAPMAALGSLLETSRWRGGRVTRARSWRTDLMAGGLDR